ITHIRPGAIAASVLVSGLTPSGIMVMAIRKNTSGFTISARFRIASKRSRRRVAQNIEKVVALPPALPGTVTSVIALPPFTVLRPAFRASLLVDQQVQVF